MLVATQKELEGATLEEDEDDPNENSIKIPKWTKTRYSGS
jgi:hypothetical protein